jgi:hypothetical protein
MTAAFLSRSIVLMIFGSSAHVKTEEARTVDRLVMSQVSEHESYVRWVDMSNVQMVTGRTRMTGWLTSATDSHSVKGLL